MAQQLTNPEELSPIQKVFRQCYMESEPPIDPLDDNVKTIEPSQHVIDGKRVTEIFREHGLEANDHLSIIIDVFPKYKSET